MLSERLKSLPYLVHTNRELGLMLKGLKPLAKFVDREGCFPNVVLRYFRLFDRQVALRRVVRRDELVASKHGPLHYVYFALPGEVWRIQAMMNLMNRTGPWTREMEREEGELLGYTNEQNDVWLTLHQSN